MTQLSLFTAFKGRLLQFCIVYGKKDCFLSCKRVGGIWYESECMFRENLNGGMRRSVFGMAINSCEILYNMTRRASDNWNSLPLNTVKKSDSVESFKSAVSLINH
jgi:hypothetical protein